MTRPFLPIRIRYGTVLVSSVLRAESRSLPSITIDSSLREKGGDLFAPVFVDGNSNNGKALELVVQFLEAGKCLDAGRTPRCPNVEEYYPPPILIQKNHLSLKVNKGK